ncbi:hypothetical protein Tco_1255911 [Tanacetum coccineum]
MGDENPIRTLGDYSKPSHEGYRNTIELPEGNNVVPLRSDTIRRAKESWALLEDLALYDNKCWNDPRDFPKPVKAISLPQYVPSTSDRRLIELENQVQRMMEAHLALKQPIQVNKISFSCEVCSGPHDTQYCMENHEQAFVEYASSRTNKAGVPRSSDTEFVCTKDDGDVMFVEIIRKYDDSLKEGPEDEENTTIEGLKVEYFDTFLTRSELAYHKKPDPRDDPNRGVSNFTGRIKGMHVFVGNFTYVINFIIFEDISSIVDPRLSQVVLGKPFVEISNMIHDPSIGVVKFTYQIDEITYKMPHKIKQYDSLSDLKKCTRSQSTLGTRRTKKEE